MTLWMASIVVIVLVIVLIFIALFKNNYRTVKLWRIVGLSFFGIMLIVVAGYIILTFLLIEDTKNDNTKNDNPKKEARAEQMIGKARPENFDLPTSDVPLEYPDVIGISNEKYEEKPVFKTKNELAKYILYQFYHSSFEFDFYLDRSVAVDEGTGYVMISDACDLAMCYYPFSAYKPYDMYATESGEEKGLKARIKLNYTKPDYDLEARAEALEFVLKNPVPEGGFEDAVKERAYARKIHDFVARRVTYSPIGYDPEKMKEVETYAAFQEAYNVLEENQTEAVCAGYARAFSLIANYAGINVAWMRGNETETQSHAWNVLYPCDGSNPVLVDVTWDDTESLDIIGQMDVVDRNFYVLLEEEYEHTPIVLMDEFLMFINHKQK